MNQEDDKEQLTAKLYKTDDTDFLEFNLGNAKIHKLNVNEEDNQGEIKALFCNLIVLVEKENLEIKLDVADDYDNKLLIEVAEAYIGDLNKELVNVRTEILDKYEQEEK